MKKLMSLFLVFSIFTVNAYAVTESELQDIADCIGAIGLTNAAMQLNGDYKNHKVGEKIASRLMDIFYEKLWEYKKSNPSVDSAYLGQMPNRSAAKYSYMGQLQQLKYASSVVDTNNCFQYAR